MATQTITRPGGEVELRDSWMPMIVVTMAQFLLLFNITALKVSVDGIAESLGTPASTIKTAIVMYSVVVAGLIIPAAKIGQRLGVRRIFRASVALFGAAMAIMAVSPGAVAGALIAGVLGASVQRHVVLNPLISDELLAQVNLDSVSFVSNDRLLRTLARTTATQEQVAEAVRINTEARLVALKVSFFVLAGLSLLAFLPAAGVPDTGPDGPGARAEGRRSYH